MTKKLKVAIACDKWKVSIFKTILKEKDYTYNLIEKEYLGLFIVHVLESELLTLKTDVEYMQNKARQSKMN